MVLTAQEKLLIFLTETAVKVMNYITLRSAVVQ
jgi:hypothetical protein